MQRVITIGLVYSLVALGDDGLLPSSFVQIDPNSGVTDSDALKKLTSFREQHRRTISGQLCAAAFVQNGKVYVNCTKEASPDGTVGREWCWLEQQLQSSGGAQDWNYCIPVTDYAIIRKRAKEEFANKSKLVIELISEVNNETSRLKAELEIGYMSCNIRLLFFFIAQA
eukprot:GHVR01173740.1.p2 GENE.GHVR01173740.1~~GHVR01173740.1.p2  ORF type:complete len:169 (+),score=17.11 GHVR01173740.1:125-631(+)